MDIVQAILLALIQGLTEFLPISSSAHLLLPKEILGWSDQGSAVDVALHVGSLTAVLVYFRHEVGAITIGGLDTLRGRWSEDGKLAWFLVLATIPVGLAGLTLDSYIESNLRDSTDAIASASLIGAGLLILADRIKKGDMEIADLSWKLVMLIGIAQATALFPGISRSGITITAAILLGFSPTSSAKFSFLMSIPVIALTGILKALQLTSAPDTQWTIIAIATLISGITAYLCIHYFLKLIQRIGLMPFAIYRIIMGAALLAFF